MINNKNIVWYGPPFSYSGYALHNRAMLFELKKLGWNIRLIPTEEHMPPHLIGKELLIEMSKNTSINPNDSIVVNLVPPPACPFWGKYTILFTTLESKTVHSGFYRRCEQFDEVWVPCTTNAQSLKKIGMAKSKIFTCSEGVHAGFWNSNIKPSSVYKSNHFTFFYNGDWSYRKGTDVIIRGFCKAFLPTDPVRLLLLVHYQGEGYERSKSRILMEFEEMKTKYGIHQTPKIEFIFEHIDDPHLPCVYKCADTYVAPTRGEAWGLPIIQAMSCGIPPIVTDWGGQMDYCNNKNSLLIKTEKFDTIDDKCGLTVDFYQDQNFAFPSLEHFIQQLRYAYNHPDKMKEKGETAREHVKRNFSWEIAGLIADVRLTEINREYIN